jgi:hypothetical protein
LQVRRLWKPRTRRLRAATGREEVRHWPLFAAVALVYMAYLVFTAPCV